MFVSRSKADVFSCAYNRKTQWRLWVQEMYKQLPLSPPYNYVALDFTHNRMALFSVLLAVNAKGWLFQHSCLYSASDSIVISESLKTLTYKKLQCHFLCGTKCPFKDWWRQLAWKLNKIVRSGSWIKIKPPNASDVFEIFMECSKTCLLILGESEPLLLLIVVFIQV